MCYLYIPSNSRAQYHSYELKRIGCYTPARSQEYWGEQQMKKDSFRLENLYCRPGIQILPGEGRPPWLYFLLLKLYGFYSIQFLARRIGTFYYNPYEIQSWNNLHPIYYSLTTIISHIKSIY